MKRLPKEVMRCAGRLSMDKTEASICPDRDTCARYLTIALDAGLSQRAMWAHSYSMNMVSEDGVCRHHREVS